MLRYFYLSVLFIVVQASVVFAAKPDTAAKKPLNVKFDSVSVTQKAFDTAALKKYHQLEEFQYRDETPQGLSMWQRFWIWFWSLFGTSDKTWVGITLNYILIALGVASLVFIVVKLTGVDPFGLIRRKSTSTNLTYSEHIENIHELNLDFEIDKAVSAKNYRLAVRMLYLRCLKQLNEAGLIAWELNKTNSQYSNELANTHQRLQFNLLTRQFEYIWYGEFDIDANVFEHVNGMFNDFKVKTT